MAHITLIELEHMIEAAGRQVSVGSHYYHYKHPEVKYLVTGISILEATDEVAVKYAMLDRPAVEFIRPLQSWLDTVELQGHIVPRFTKVD